MMLPLIRLKVSLESCLYVTIAAHLTSCVQVETTGVKEMMNAGRFGQRFVDRIANPKDVLQYYRKKVQVRRRAYHIGR